VSARAVEAVLHGTPGPRRSESLLDVVDSLIDKGVALDAEVVLGLADVDLVYLRVGALLAAADRVFRAGPRNRRSRRTASQPMPCAPGGETRPLSAGLESSPRARSGTHRATRAMTTPSSLSTRPSGVATDDTSRSVIRLVLTVVEFIRQLLERQAVRRVRENTLTPLEIERLGSALMQLESTVHELADRHGLDPSDLNLDLGPLGTLR
jgi:hypothetical protein